MTSVVIAAHDEEAVIGRCLSALLADAAAGEFDVTVVANGCSDHTAERASRHGVVRVLDLPVANKAAALNAGDAVAEGFPRIYLDADVVVPTQGLRDLRDALGAGSAAPLAVTSRRHLDLDGRPLVVRGYFAVHGRLPALRSGLFGRGVVALSATGRRRFTEYPDVVADDLFLDGLFAPHEKQQVDSVVSRIRVPHTTRHLVHRLARVRRGNAQLRRSGTAKGGPGVRPADRLSWLRDVVLPRPWLAPAALCYVGVTVAAGARARRADVGWGRDASTRTQP